ncbi:MAG TPA: metallophosphoesterase [Synergistaceae bacterium]|nr:metallophosphoesterase [Synergistaceae bacterium]HPJ25475.1 metallophosphoesterase [Synergistaceae bacterium]HPQ36534.1 metallophosphoesterase [Synergistaceae bacterium]
MNIFQIFLLSVLLLYGGANFYVLHHLRQAFPRRKNVFALFWILGALAYPLGRILRSFFPGSLVFFLLFWGALFLAGLIYGVFWAFLWDLLSLSKRIFRGRREKNPRKARAFWILAGSVTALLLLWGYRNAAFPRIATLSLEAPSPGIGIGEERNYRIAFLSDIHAGKIVAKKRLNTIRELLYTASPDMVILGGDILENAPRIADAIGFPQTMESMKAPLGLYGITGNHEYYAGLDILLPYFEKCGITMLRDEAVLVDNAFLLLGRNDRRAAQFGDTRKNPEEILSALPEEYRNYPLIIANHTPTREDFLQALECDALLQLSGHTHHGQLFPFNFITASLFQKSWGLFTEGNTSLYVSSGAGTWGPPIRTNSVSEIVLIRLRLYPQEF